MSLVWLAAVAAVTASASTLTPPATVIAQLPQVTEIRRIALLPAGIAAGKFTVDGVSAARWQIAEPGGAFSATDVPVPGAPGRRLIFAACDPHLCLLHYERGGIAHFYEILALSLTSSGWKAIWNARGPKPLKDLDALRSLLLGDTPSGGWSQQSVKGDF